MSLRTVTGYCPMGCGATLAYANNRIICWSEDCPRPSAVEEILNDGEHDHLVELDYQTFVIQHPLRERLDASLFRCSLHDTISNMTGPPQPPGRYRVSDDLEWEALS